MGISANLANTNTVTLAQNTGVTVVPVAAGGPGPTGPGGTGVLELAEGAAVPGGTPVDTLIYRKGGGVNGVVGKYHVNASTSTNPVDVALTADVAAGSTIVATLGYNLQSGAELTWGATDPRGNLWTFGPHQASATRAEIVAYCHVAADLKSGMVVQFRPVSGATTKASVVLGAFAGFLVPSGPDVTGVATSASGNVTGPGVTTTQANEILVGGVSSTWSTPGTPTGGWTLLDSEVTSAGGSEVRSGLYYKAVSVAGLQTLTVTAGTGGGGWSSAVAAFKLEPTPRLQGIWDGTTVLQPYPLGKPAKGSYRYVSRDNGTQRWRSEDVDPRDFAGDTAGVFGTGNATKDTACLQAAMAACAQENGGIKGGLTLNLPQGKFLIEQPLVRVAPFTIRGQGIYQTVLSPTAAMVDQWVWTDQDMCRHSTRQANDTSFNYATHNGGASHDGLSIVGDRTLGVIHGYRTTGTADDMRVGSFGVYMLAGIGVRLGDPDPAGGLSPGGTLRECLFHDFRVEQCGDDQNTTHAEALWSGGVNYGLPAFDLTQAFDGVTGVDGTNEVIFNSLWCVFNHGTVFFRDWSSTEVYRRTIIKDWMLHGNIGVAGEQNRDLCVIEGLVTQFEAAGWRSNGCTAVNQNNLVIRGKAWGHKLTKGGSGLTSFTVTVAGQTTASIAAAASAATVQTALEALSNVDPGDVVVTLSGSVYTLEWVGNANRGWRQAAPTVTATPTGGTGTVTVSVTGDRPRGIRIQGNVTQSTGSGVKVEDCDSFELRIGATPSSITNYELEIAATSTVSPGNAAIGQAVVGIVPSSGATATHKMSIPANCDGLIDFIGAPKTATTAQLTSATAAVNVYGKHTGKIVVNSTTGNHVYATGNQPTSVWNDLLTRALAHTPT